MSQTTRLDIRDNRLFGMNYELDNTEVDKVRAHLGHEVGALDWGEDTHLKCYTCNETITIKGGLQNERD